ncbi:MAG: hypothetical protein K2G75_07130 [Muribaculaceae bacterium]|nr:hypothetical protein [Muribaculaceae bacterium]MDE5925079.1 hypothetical protein [Muribaculaceae bacterium]
MEFTEKTIRSLRPTEGHLLTQAADVADADRIFSTLVYLAVGDSPDNWREIPEAEADAIRKRVAEEREAQQKAEAAEARRKELEAELAALNAGEGVGNA